MRNFKIDFFKALCIFGVLLHHVSNGRIDAIIRDYVSILVGCLTWAIFGFVVCSAYIYSENRDCVGFVAECKSRFMRLMIPYYVIGFCYALLYCFVSKSGASGFVDSLGRLVFFDAPIGEQLYFLPMLFICSVPWILFNKIALGNTLKIWLALIFSVVPYVVFEIAGGQVWGRGVTIGILLIAFSAYGFGYIYPRVDSGRRSVLVFLGVLVGALFELFGVFHGLVVTLLAVAIMHFCLSVPERFFVFKLVRYFCWIGKRSSWIFAYHSPFFIYVPMVLFLKFGIPDVFTIVLAVISAVALSVATGSFFSMFKFRKFLLA